MSLHSLAWVGENIYRDRGFSGHDRVGHDGGGQRAWPTPSSRQSARGRCPEQVIARGRTHDRRDRELCRDKLFH